MLGLSNGTMDAVNNTREGDSGANDLLSSFRRCRMAGFLNAKGSTEKDKQRLQKWDQEEMGRRNPTGVGEPRG